MPAQAEGGTGLLRILSYGAAVLRQVAIEAQPGSGETRELLDDMWRTLTDDGGVGLAAPQVGVARRVIVVRNPEQPAARQRLDLVNPRVIRTFGDDHPFEEGCLSFPGLYTTVWRPRGVEVEFHDIDGQVQRLKDDGLVARIILHEIDHLEGILFIDHLSFARRLWHLPRLTLILAGNVLGKMRFKR
nr:peptide deformylase [Candidatus Krumholzibacteria bacterium]